VGSATVTSARRGSCPPTTGHEGLSQPDLFVDSFAAIDRLACLAFIVIVLTTALVIAYRRDQRTAAHCRARPNYRSA